jgi:GNAT superfamily N-acetyltransferase
VIEERIANLTDLDFISSCILYGARKGHYSIDGENQANLKCMKNELRSIITDQELADTRYAQATIYSVEGKRIAFVIISEASPGDSCYEIYAMSLKSSHQNKGYGSQILDSVLNRFIYLDICARCLPASDRMIQILVQRGFKFNSKDKDCMVMLRTAIDDYSLAEPVFMRC